jgi:hypothetical protein
MAKYGKNFLVAVGLLGARLNEAGFVRSSNARRQFRPRDEIAANGETGLVWHAFVGVCRIKPCAACCRLQSSCPRLCGAVKAIAVGAPKRMALLPDLPAVAETVPGFTAVSWFALFGPAGMPPDVTAKVSGEVREIFSDPQVRENFLDIQYFESIAGSPEALSARIGAEEPKWRKLIQESHITVER